MVLVDVDIIAGDDDGIAYFGVNSYGGTGYIKTDSALYKTETVVSIGTNQGREEYPNTITPTTILTTNTGGKAYFIFKGITIPQGSKIMIIFQIMESGEGKRPPLNALRRKVRGGEHPPIPKNRPLSGSLSANGSIGILGGISLKRRTAPMAQTIAVRKAANGGRKK